MLNQELIAKEFCFWLADSLRLGSLTKNEAEQLSLIFKVGLTKSNRMDDLMAYLEGVAQVFPVVPELINKLKNQNQRTINSQNKEIIVEFAQKFIGDPEMITFLQEANKESDIEKLSNQFPKFADYRKSQKS